MSTSQNDDPVSREPISKETGLVRRSVFLTKRVRELAQQVRSLEPVDRPDPQDALGARDYWIRGLRHRAERQYEQAIQDYNELIRLYPTYPLAYSARGRVHRVLGQHDLAIQDFDEAIRSDPTNSLAFAARGRAYRSLGNSTEAERDFQKAKELGYTP